MKVTVIIPVYNAEKHLDECIQSVLKQNFEDFEILLINDGSTDASGIICDAYAAKDHRVKVFHKKNGGVSSARNLGLENAAGEWFTFIDADDYIAPDYFKVLEQQTDADLILQGLIYVENGHVIKQNTYLPENLILDDFLQRYEVYPDFSSSWSKFFRKVIIRKWELSFNKELSYGEDTLFNLSYLQHCKSITTHDFAGYFYRISGSGLTHTPYDYQHDLKFYRAFKKQFSIYINTAFLMKAFEIPLTRLSKSIYHDKTIQPFKRRKILKELVSAHFQQMLNVYTDPKIKGFFIAAYCTRIYFFLDFVLLNLTRRSK